MAEDDLLTERLLRVIDEGRRTATYKLALLLALLDAAASDPHRDEVPTGEIAASVLALYFPQVRGYVANDGIKRELRQISMKESPAIRAIFKLHLEAEVAGHRRLADVRDRLPAAYGAALESVEATFVRYPIPLLQVVGSQLLPFLYHPDWAEGASVHALRKQGRSVVRFLPGVRERLVVLGPLLRPLIELHWSRDVARWTRLPLEDHRLRAHLFGTDRLAFPRALRRGLFDLQSGSCFYCSATLRSSAQVDHFLAWSRWPNDAIENLVLADGCNGAKSDHLAAPDHVDRSGGRLRERRGDLRQLATDARWTSDADRSAGLVRSTYRTVVAGVPLWVRGRDFIVAGGPIDIQFDP